MYGPDAIALTEENGNPTLTGLAQAEAVLLSVMEWGAADNIVAFSFDTTTSNMGIYSGAAIRMNHILNRPADNIVVFSFDTTTTDLPI